MSIIKANQIRTKLLSIFEQHLKLEDVGANDPEREPKVLSRCVAAQAIQLQTGCSVEEAAHSVWDGADDNGIDAAFFDTATSRVVFAQAKWISKGSGEPEAKDIGAFVKGVRDALEQDSSNFHQRLQARFADIALRTSTPGVQVHLVIASTGASSLATHGTAVIQDFLEEINGDDPQPILSSETIGLSEIYAGLSGDAAIGTVPVEATILDWSFIASPFPAYFGVIDGLQLKAWWKAYGRKIVSANIRHALGATDVNNEIKQTAQGSPDNFWYFNNGITLVAEEAWKAPAGTVSRSAGNFAFKGASIVNGAQTVSSLATVDDDQALGHVRVPIRVILLKSAPIGFGDDVTRTNNLQNRVESRDFVAQDMEQKRLREEMAIEGIDYQVVRSEDSVSSPNACELVELTTALACASGDSSFAVQVKTGIGRFFADLKKPPYKALFNPSTNGARAFNATLTLRAIEGWIDRKKKEVPKKSGPPWGVLIHGNRILAAVVFHKFGEKQLNQPIQSFSQNLQQVQIDQLCEDSYGKMADRITANYPGKFLATLFKNPTMSKDVFDYAKG